MVYYKKIERTIKVDGKERKPLKLRAEVFSYDKQVSKFVFTLTNEEYEFDLTAASTLVVLEYSVDGQQGSIEAISGVESIADSQIYFIVPEKLRGFVGTVKAGVYVNLKSGEQIDIQNIQFKMSKSMIDSMSGPAADFYFESFNDVLVKVRAAGDKAIVDVNAAAKKVSDHADQKIKEYDGKFTQSNQKMNELQQSQMDLSNQLNETNKKIDEADVYRKNEVFNKQESSANVIDQISGSETVTYKLVGDFVGKEIASFVENPNFMARGSATQIMTPTMSGWSENDTWYSYAKVAELDGNISNPSTTTLGSIRQVLMKYNVLEIVTRKLGEQFWVSQGATTTLEKVVILKKIVRTMSSNVWGYGSCPNGNQLRIGVWLKSSTSWATSNGTTSSVIKKVSSNITPSSIPQYIDEEGWVYANAYTEATDGTIASTLFIDCATLDFTIEISANDIVRSMIAAYHGEMMKPVNILINDLVDRVEALEGGI